MCSNSGRPCRVYVYIPPSKLHRHQSNNLPRKDVKSDDATTKAKRPPRTRVIRRFPSEVCRLITEIVDPSDLPSLSVVSTSFRTEAQRLIFQRLTMKKSSKAVAAECIRGLLDSPRLWTLIRHLDIWHVHLTRASRDVPIIERLATLFSKLVNLTSLTVRDHVHWDKCDGLFDKCAFRLKSLHIHFLPDHDLIAFLASQRSIVDLSWYPTTAGTTDSSFPFNPIQWPANLLPNLTVYAYYGRFPALLTSHLMHGRPITHFKSDLTPPPLQDLMRSSRLVKGLYIPPLDVNETISAGADFPYLEAFGILRYSTEKETPFIAQFLPHMKHLRRLSVFQHPKSPIPKIQLVLRFHAACPSLRMIELQGANETTRSTYEWCDVSESWVELPVLRDWWSECVREARDSVQS